MRQAGRIQSLKFENIMSIKYTLNSPFWPHLKSQLGNAEFLSAWQERHTLLYEGRVWDVLIHIGELDREIRTVLQTFPKQTTYVHASIAIKFYLIACSTLLDLLLLLISETLDLGMKPQKVRLDVILKNSIVKDSRIPDVFAKYRSLLSQSKLKDIRNDIVHRGFLDDVNLREITAKLDDAIANDIMSSKNPDQSAYSTHADLIGSYMKKKKRRFSSHYQQTEVFVFELMNVLAETFGEKIQINRTEKKS